MILVDTSAWIDYLRRAGTPAAHEIRRLLSDDGAVATTEPVVMELLAGAVDHRALAQLEALTTGLPLLAVDSRLDYRDAAVIYRAARRQGFTVRRLVDCLIAAVAVRNAVPLLHKDGDFEAIASVVPLQHTSLR